MATIVLTDPIDFPIATLRALLKQHQPQYRWQCGEFDEGGSSDKVVFDRTQLVLGRADSEIIMINATPVKGAFSGPDGDVPPHEHHVVISNPTTDDSHIASRLQILLCTALTEHCHDQSIRCQLLPKGPWMNASELRDALILVTTGISLANLDTAIHDAPIRPSVTPPPGPTEFASLILLLDGPLHFDWNDTGDLIGELDPDGDWQANFEPAGQGVLHGRGGMITLKVSDAPLGADLVEQGLARSPWFDGDPARVLAHRSQLIISLPVEPGAGFGDKRAFALIMSLIACIAAHGNGVTGLYNSSIGTVHDPATVTAQLPLIAQREVAIALWTCCNWHGSEDGDVSLSTSGFAAFLGYELEAWHAPVETRFLQQKIDGLMGYLFAQGPVIADGDSIGTTDDGRTITCTFGNSRAERLVTTRAMILEFGPPLDDAATAQAVDEEAAVDPRSFGRKGL